MSKNSSQHLLDANNEAEGSPDEIEEPSNPLRTSTLPAINDIPEPARGETGLSHIVRLGVEGTDNNEAQDASLTKDETALPQSARQNTERDFTGTPVLIVEDTVELAEVIQATLKGMGLEARYATHGKTGLEKLKSFDPQLILLDIGLPDITGWKMLDHIKEHYGDDVAAMPSVIIITAYGDPANRLIGKLQNIHSYLIKPFTPDQVERIVTMALNGEKPENPTIGGEEESPS
jgi:CheY-like chemotaxis protein